MVEDDDRVSSVDHTALSGKIRKMHFTKMTSAKMIRREETTTLLVAARPTPSAPSFVVYPKNDDTVPIMKPNTAVFTVGGTKLDHSTSVKARVTYSRSERWENANSEQK